MSAVSEFFDESLGLLLRAWREQKPAAEFAADLMAEGRRGYLVDARYPGSVRPHAVVIVAEHPRAVERARYYCDDSEKFKVASEVRVFNLANGLEVLTLHAKGMGRMESIAFPASA